MKITLDLDQLLEQKLITSQEYERFKILGDKSTTSLAFNLILGFGVIAVCTGIIALVPKASTVIFIGPISLIAGVILLKKAAMQWSLLAQICILVGALMLGIGLIWINNGSLSAFIAIAAIYAVTSVIAQSGLLAFLCVVSIGPILGTGTGYSHTAYYLAIYEPLLTVISFTIIGTALYYLSKIVNPVYERIAIIASRTCLFMVNLGFWIGSLWGDKTKLALPSFLLSNINFSLMWAVALIITGIWAWKRQKRWVINVVAVFAGIHFYTQWFKHLDVTPITVLIAGILALILALMIRQLNMAIAQKSTP